MKVKFSFLEIQYIIWIKLQKIKMWNQGYKDREYLKDLSGLCKYWISRIIVDNKNEKSCDTTKRKKKK